MQRFPFFGDVTPRRMLEEMKPQLHLPENLKPSRNITLFVKLQAMEMEIWRIVSIALLE